MSKSESLIFVEDCKRLRYLKFDGLKFLNNHFEIKNLQTVIFFFFLILIHMQIIQVALLQLHDVTIISFYF